jgi:5-methylcytosine-specific restriction protein A
MNTWLLTWNPDKWTYWNLEADVSALKKKGFIDSRWSCGRTKRIESGDRVFLMRQGSEPRGVIASGQSRSSAYLDAHWDENRKDKALYVDVRFDALLNPETDGALAVAKFKSGPLATVNWSTQSSGISIAPQAALLLENIWREFLNERGQSPVVFAEEVSTPALYFEGASHTIAVNVYERDPRARQACIEHYGATCVVCGFDFAARYGEIGRGFIHVHHLIPLSQIRNSYKVDPVSDLRPVCPNCHAMLHRRAEMLTIDELRRTIAKLRAG